MGHATIEMKMNEIINWKRKITWDSDRIQINHPLHPFLFSQLYQTQQQMNTFIESPSYYFVIKQLPQL